MSDLDVQNINSKTGNSAISIADDGNVGIGTSTTGVTGLSIEATKNLGWTQSSGESLANMFRQQSSGALVMGYGYQRSSTANGFASSYSSSLSRAAASFSDSIRFYVDTASTVAAGTDITPTEAMRIDSSGNVGIGRTPGYRLDVEEASPANGIVQRIGATGSTGAQIMFFQSGISNWAMGQPAGADDFAFWSGRTSAAAGTERMRIDNGGIVLIGKSSSSYNNPGTEIRPTVAGFTTDSGIAIIANRQNTNGEVIQLRKNNVNVGSIDVATSSTSYNTSSDVRLKENIVDAPAGNIDAIRVRSFDWKADGTHQTYGMVAQELVDVAPEAVSQGETDDDMWGVDYSKLVPMMIKEIQDLKAEVAALKGA